MYSIRHGGAVGTLGEGGSSFPCVSLERSFDETLHDDCQDFEYKKHIHASQDTLRFSHSHVGVRCACKGLI